MLFNLNKTIDEAVNEYEIIGDDEFDVYDCENLNLDSDEDEDSEIASSDDETYSRPFEFQSITESKPMRCFAHSIQLCKSDLFNRPKIKRDH
ncbi:hypothetical protein BpHYR1_041736 [Brachionus plicatilis]|uniref:Uncharacterized protein n=1 Tax=Brachionus plicatilis TaxID=10195 RepID=A0A3M7S7C2_BRAPC|nr:hypothetical protein BpHYR1_041736 [Brachionus plicatilis]